MSHSDLKRTSQPNRCRIVPSDRAVLQEGALEREQGGAMAEEQKLKLWQELKLQMSFKEERKRASQSALTLAVSLPFILDWNSDC